MELCILTPDNRLASLGHEYTYLKSIYPTWSSELHALGNILPNHKLETIATHGLITWYLEQNFNIDVNYSYHKNISYFIDNPTKITFYDFCKIYIFSEKFQKEDKLIKSCNYYKLQFLLKKFPYKNSVKSSTNKINFTKYSSVSFYKYLLDYEFEEDIDKLKLWLLEIKLNIDENYSSDMNILSDFVTNYPYVKVWGIIFQKFKIILEKSNILRKEYIYKLDRFVDKVQQYTYTLIYRYSNSSKEDKYYQTDYIQDEFTEFLKDKRLLYIYDLTDEKFTELMKEPQFI